MSRITINVGMALNRISESPYLMVTADEAYYLLYGEVAPKSVLLRAWQLLDEYVWEHVKCAYYISLIKMQEFFDDDASANYIALEDAPPGAKEGEMFFAVSDIDLFLRRGRCDMYHPSLGIRLTSYDLGNGEIRIAVSDLAQHLRGEPEVEHWIPAMNPLNAQSGVRS